MNSAYLRWVNQERKEGEWKVCTNATGGDGPGGEGRRDNTMLATQSEQGKCELAISSSSPLGRRCEAVVEVTVPGRNSTQCTRKLMSLTALIVGKFVGGGVVAAREIEGGTKGGRAEGVGVAAGTANGSDIRGIVARGLAAGVVESLF